MIENYTCPNCGAPLNYNEQNGIFKCEYCSSIIDLAITEEERQIRLGVNTATKVKEYEEHLIAMNTLQGKVTEQENKYNSVLDKKKNLKANTVIIASFIAIIISIIAVSWMNIVFYAYDFLRIFLEIILVGATIFGTVNFGKKRYKSDFLRLSKQVTKQNEILSDIQREFNQEKNSFNIDYVDEQYREIEALDFIISALETGRAFTLRQAENLWDDKKERNELMTKLEQLPRSNNDNSDVASTIATGTAAVVGAAVVRGIVKEVFKNI